jgi:hypothetical protein
MSFYSYFTGYIHNNNNQRKFTICLSPVLPLNSTASSVISLSLVIIAQAPPPLSNQLDFNHGKQYHHRLSAELDKRRDLPAITRGNMFLQMLESLDQRPLRFWKE